MCWQGWLRKAAKDYDHVVVSGIHGHLGIYDDFCDVYVSHGLHGVKDCWRLMVDEARLRKVDDELAKFGGTRLRPVGRVSPANQEFIKFGDAAKVPDEMRYDVLLHARGAVGQRGYHQWGVDDATAVAMELSARGYRVAGIGAKGQSSFLRGFDNLHGAPLVKLVNVFSAAKLLVSPSSGPAMLASLCGLPFLCWTDNGYRSAVGMRDGDRIKTVWNPLDTKCRVLVRHDWRPPVEEIVVQALEMLQEK
jgi:hypothetical protein